MELLRESEPIARKDYICNASEYVREYLHEEIFTISDYRLIVKAKRNGYRIRAGERYIKLVQADQREIITYRAIPAMNDLCLKYDLFSDDW